MIIAATSSLTRYSIPTTFHAREGRDQLIAFPVSRGNGEMMF
jgi:hypothetical protein